MPTASDRPLSQLLLSRLSAKAGGSDDPDLEAALGDALARARRAWPGLTLPDAEFVSDLAERLPASERPAEAVRALCAEDLFLAGSCRRGDARALAEFERRVLPQARAALLTRRESPESVDEALQALRARLFVGSPDAPGKIAEYSGRGPLSAWVRMAAVRVALNLNRGKVVQAGTSLGSQLAAPATPPELGYVKARYRADFKAAFEASFASLPQRERTLLRLNLIDGLSTTKLARVYRADASTVRRWLADARKSLVEGTRRELAKRLHASERELESIIGLLVTQLEDSVQRILGGGGDGGAGSPNDRGDAS